MATKLSAGDLIQIYQDPITKQQSEGSADLRRFIGNDIDGLERWRVHFVGDHAADEYDRIVDPVDRI